MSTKGLRVVVIEASREVRRFDEMLKDEHYLKSSRPVGDFLRQVVMRGDDWVGLLAWGACSYALQDRDEAIGWTAPLRASRQKLLVQNRRFLIPGKSREPNLASQVLAAAIDALPAQWMDRFEYSPVLAETFTDIELFAGTCYKASGWLPVGLTKGYGRHRADFYRFHGRPKRLWLKPLGGLSMEQVKELLCGPLPDDCLPGAHSSDAGLLPVPEPMLYSLASALQQVPDPRSDNRSFRCGTLLSIVAMALLSGSRNISEIHRFGQRLKHPHRKKLGLPRNKKFPKLSVAPSYKVYYNLLCRLDLNAFAKTLTQWLQAGVGKLPACLAIDGKMIRNLIGVLSVSEHETGVPVAVAIQTEKEGDGENCELVVGRRTLTELAPVLDQKLITSDALHTQKDNAITVTDAGGDYLMQLKDNRPKLRALAEAKASVSPLLPRKRKAHAAIR